MSTKRYYEFTESERLALTPEETLAAVKIEAISRGIRPPTDLPEELQSAGFAGFQVPAGALKVYEIVFRPEQYGSTQESGLCFKTEEEAFAAAKGALCLWDTYVGSRPIKRLASGNITVQARFLGEDVGFSYSKKLEECEDSTPSEAFEKLCEECRDDQARLRQEAYNKKVRRSKRAEYVQLAKGDLEVAAAFWRKVESGDFPSDEEGGI